MASRRMVGPNCQQYCGLCANDEDCYGYASDVIGLQVFCCQIRLAIKTAKHATSVFFANSSQFATRSLVDSSIRHVCDIRNLETFVSEVVDTYTSREATRSGFFFLEKLGRTDCQFSVLLRRLSCQNSALARNG